MASTILGILFFVVVGLTLWFAPATVREFLRRLPALMTVRSQAIRDWMRNMAARITRYLLDSGTAAILVVAIIVGAGMGFTLLDMWREAAGTWHPNTLTLAKSQVVRTVALFLLLVLLDGAFRVARQDAARWFPNHAPHARWAVVIVRVLVGLVAFLVFKASADNVLDLAFATNGKVLLAPVDLAVFQALCAWDVVNLTAAAGLVLLMVLRAYQDPAVARVRFANGRPVMHPEFVTAAGGRIVDASNTPVLITGPSGTPYSVTLDAAGEIEIGDGAVVIHDDGRLTEDGEPLTRNNIPGGVPLTRENVLGQLLRHPLAGWSEIERQGWRPERLHVVWSVLALMAVFALTGYTALALGITTQKIGFMVMAAGCLGLVMAPILVMAAAIEYVPLPDRFRELVQAVTNMPKRIIVALLCTFACVMVVPDFRTLTVVVGAQVVGAFIYSAMIWIGRGDKAKAYTERMVLWLGAILPGAYVLFTLWGFLSADGETKQTGTYRGNWLLRFFNGSETLEPHKWYVNTGGLLLCVALAWLFAWLGAKLADEKFKTWGKLGAFAFMLAFAAPPLIAAGYCGWGLMANIFGTKIAMPGALPKPEPVTLAPAAPTALTATLKKNEQGKPLVHLVWTNESDLTDGYTIRRKQPRDVMRGHDGVSLRDKDNKIVTEWGDTDVKPGERYCYEIIAHRKKESGGTADSEASNTECITIAAEAASEQNEEDATPQDTGSGQPNAGNVQPPQAVVANSESRKRGEYPDDL